ncbi:hypothetical protein PR048_000591 [Dryococelus australis]|uniref:Uncharacterized protein n=1 Tax=Dryococelus australis TaxID=614101 RepID=A0ABQ9IG01_9NEOP|nr:hypothetical protein PR048_000591 [Dryococelus australis]
MPYSNIFRVKMCSTTEIVKKAGGNIELQINMEVAGWNGFMENATKVEYINTPRFFVFHSTTIQQLNITLFIQLFDLRARNLEKLVKIHVLSPSTRLSI